MLLLLAGLLQGASPTASVVEPKPYVATHPDWLSKPSGDDMARVFPKSAAKKGIEGRATIQCQVNAAGRLVDCTVLSEEPVGEDFGSAAIGLSTIFRMRPATRDGQAVEGGTVRIPLRFVLAGGSPDVRSTMLICYGATAAALERNPGEPGLPAVAAAFAGQVASRELEAKTTPEGFEAALASARRQAVELWGKPGTRDTLARCVAAIKKQDAKP